MSDPNQKFTIEDFFLAILLVATGVGIGLMIAGYLVS